MAPNEEQPTERVRGHEDDWRNSIRSGQWSDVAKLLADDYTNTDADGNVWKKDVDIENCTSGRYKVKSLSNPAELELRLCGDQCVIITGKDTVEATFNGKDVSGTYRWTDTWVKMADGWRCVASHSSRVPK